MFDFLKARLRQGTPGVRVRDMERGLPANFRGCPAVQPGGRVDLGGCLFSPEEAGGAVEFSADPRMSSRTREGLVLEGPAAPRAAALDAKMRAVFGRSLKLRSVSAGGCNGCEAELNALSNVVFDMARFGIQFVASPRHADGLVITGPVTRNMREALIGTWEAVPEPRLVIAVGACAISGGPFRGGPEVLNGAPDLLPVDLYLPGCPPHPLTVLDGLLRLLGQVDERRESKPRAPGA